MDSFGNGFGKSNHSAYRRNMQATGGLGFDLSDVERLTGDASTSTNDTSKGDPTWGPVIDTSAVSESPRYDVSGQVDYSTTERVSARPAQRHAVNIGPSGQASERVTELDTPAVIVPAGGIAVLEDGSAAGIIYRVNPIPASVATPGLPASSVAVSVAVIFAGEPGAFPLDGISDTVAMNTLLATAATIGYSGRDPFLALSALVEAEMAIVGQSDPAAALLAVYGGDDYGIEDDVVGGGGFTYDREGGASSSDEGGMQSGPIVAALALGAAWLLTRGG